MLIMKEAECPRGGGKIGKAKGFRLCFKKDSSSGRGRKKRAKDSDFIQQIGFCGEEKSVAARKRRGPRKRAAPLSTDAYLSDREP